MHKGGPRHFYVSVGSHWLCWGQRIGIWNLQLLFYLDTRDGRGSMLDGGEGRTPGPGAGSGYGQPHHVWEPCIYFSPSLPPVLCYLGLSPVTRHSACPNTCIQGVSLLLYVTPPPWLWLDFHFILPLLPAFLPKNSLPRPAGAHTRCCLSGNLEGHLVVDSWEAGIRYPFIFVK